MTATEEMRDCQGELLSEGDCLTEFSSMVSVALRVREAHRVSTIQDRTVYVTQLGTTRTTSTKYPDLYWKIELDGEFL